MDNIILIGMPGAGKSTIGVVLAKTLGYGFVDADLVIQQQQGALLQQLLDRFGTDAFLDMEAQAITSIRCSRTVISPGGSCVLRETSMDHLHRLGTLVYLRLSYPVLEKRIHDLHDRGIAFAPGQTLRDVYDQRVPLYERWADLTVEADGRTVRETLAAVREALAASAHHKTE